MKSEQTVKQQHLPVMPNEIIHELKEVTRELNHFFDGTFGRGGHSMLVRDEFGDIRVTATDRDLDAVAYAGSQFPDLVEQEKLRVIHSVFSNQEVLSEFQEPPVFDAALLDLGVSSPQLDKSERGFSFYNSGPLDMRMDQSQELTAADIVNTWDAQDLSDLFYQYGEIKFPNKVVRAIINDREEKPFETTEELSGLIERVDGWRKKSKHPATSYFLALRLMVNKELEVLKEALPEIIKMLKHEGRLLVLTFHSLEDRIVKQFMKGAPELGRMVYKKVIKPTEEELKINPRSRSAKLRVFERLIE